jgi:hypothetical protein
MTLTEAFSMLQTLGPARAVDKWGADALNSPPVTKACSITLAGIGFEPSDDIKENAAIMAHILWLVAIAFEAGRIYEGGIPT